MSLFLRNQVTPYVILFIERDGSTYLTSLLTSHPQVQAVYERFAVLKQKDASAQDQLRWAKEFFTPPLIGRWKAIGFKTKLVDVLDRQGFVEILEQKNCHVIQMRRRNFIKAVISRINARQLYEATGNWNLYDKGDRRPPMQVDLQEFDRFLLEREQADQELDKFVSALELPKIMVEYEDLLYEKEKTLSKIFAFLRIRDFTVESKTLKHTSDDLREVVLNFEELRSHYRGTVYQDMFDEASIRTPAQTQSSALC